MLLRIDRAAWFEPVMAKVLGGAGASRWGVAGMAFLWTATVTGLASAKALLGIGALFVGEDLDHPIPMWVFVLLVAVFAGAGLYLVVMGRRDARAVPLGLFYVLVASAFSERLLVSVAHGVPAIAPLALFLRRVPVDAYLAFFLWKFVGDFPRRSAPRRGLAGIFVAISFALGTLLLLANLAARFAPGVARVAGRWAGALDAEGTLYWVVVFGLILPSLGYALVRATRSSPGDRRRVGILLAGVVFGFGPALIVVLLSGVPAVGRFLDRPAGLRAVGVVVYPALLSIPITTAYAVLAYQALDVRLVLRRALQYALARSTLIGVVALPFVVLAVLLYTRREDRLTDLVSGHTGVLLGLLLGVGTAALYLRMPLMEILDRGFFREQYDGRVVLAALVDSAREIRDPRELARVLAREIDRALHLRSAHTLLLDPTAGVLRSPGDELEPLPMSTRLARRLESEGVPLEVNLQRPAGWLGALPDGERPWLWGAEARLLVPISAADGSLLGVVVLGEKRSELPFTGEDRQLLATIGSSVALWLEHRLLLRVRHGDPAGARLEPPASECAGCGAVCAPGTVSCPACGAHTAEAPVPLMLGDKFRFVQRLGKGGMGVVYRAVDLALDRDVAVKTLPRMNPREARALRREARVMAAVSHPNLALIFGAESWSGAPLLVVEYLPGGTLAERIARGPLPVDEALCVAAALVAALERLHGAGILHRDIKPSNIGYAGDGTVKLLDFGVARVMEVARQEEPRRRRSPAATGVSLGTGPTAGGEWQGTLLYLSPEAVRGESPDPSLDLWALCMVIYESLLGKHPLAGDAPQRLILRLYDGEIPDPGAFPQLPLRVQAFLRDAFHPDRHRRPSSARELAQRLTALRAAPPLAT
jgi:hypothetical protein